MDVGAPAMRLRTFLPLVFACKLLCAVICVATLFLPDVLLAQSVGLPAPRLLTTMPMGGQVGTQVELMVTGEYLEDADQLLFSDSRITASRKVDSNGEPVPNRYLVSIGSDCPPGLYEARIMTRLGVSSSRAFSIGTLPETVRSQPNTTLKSAMPIPVNSICNASMTDRGVDYYSFEAKKGQRLIVDCATRGIDSKLDAVVIVADSSGRDLLVERRGGAIDFKAPDDGKYVIKLHDLTFKGGPAYYYRLGIWELPPDASISRLPTTMPVNSFSWPPQGLGPIASTQEVEPNDRARPQSISLPCDVQGSFFPAADVDVFQFEAKKGDVWWVEIGSERLGLPTDPAALVQRVIRNGESETLSDVMEFGDIPSPVKVSSNGYAYDGPPYNAGTSDFLGKLDIKEDGVYRLQLVDLYGGTRSDPRNVYRLAIRKAAPDFALVAWALHMELRNGDRNAVSKPLALRGGATMALEVVAIRRDGFQGEIVLKMEGLPQGVTAQGLKIPAGQSRGLMLVTAAQDAPRSVANATFFGSATIDGVSITRPCRVASMAFPIPDAWGEIPSPRLIADVPVSVCGGEMAPLSLCSASKAPITVVAGEKITIPLALTRRSEFSGGTLNLRTMGAGFEGTAPFDVALTADQSQAILDTAALKTPPGEYQIAFYGGAVAKYRHHPAALVIAEESRRKAELELQTIEANLKDLTTKMEAAPTAEKADHTEAIEAVKAKQKMAAAALAVAAERLMAANQAAQPQDIVDIVVSEPIAIQVTPTEKK